MSDPVRLWIAAAHHAAFLNGGWAYVWQSGTELRGAAGGERRTTRGRMALSGLAAALAELPKDAEPLVAHAAAADAAVLSSVFVPPQDPPEADLELRARIDEAMAGRPARLVRVAPDPGTPLAFAAAWAELASDKAKMAGAFNAVIPRPNLAKVAGL